MRTQRASCHKSYISTNFTRKNPAKNCQTPAKTRKRPQILISRRMDFESMPLKRCVIHNSTGISKEGALIQEAEGFSCCATMTV